MCALQSARWRTSIGQADGGVRMTENRPHPSGIVLTLAVLALVAGATRPLATGGQEKHEWPMIGHDSRNTRRQPFEHSIGPRNVSRLALKWVATTAGDVSATPAVVDGAVYFGDFGGMLWKLDAETGQVIWSHSVFDYTGIAGDIVRTSPSVRGKHPRRR